MVHMNLSIYLVGDAKERDEHDELSVQYFILERLMEIEVPLVCHKFLWISSSRPET